MTKVFDTSTLKGLRAAERWQARMYEKFDSVQVYTIGLNRVQIVALRPIKKIRCNQCEALMINGVFCHETGCPNTHSRYDADSQEWIKQRKCFECGCTVDADDPCCNAPVED